VVAGLFTRLWVPVGNTGDTNVDASRTMSVPPDLLAIHGADGG
jgi:hypothetical protein